MTMASGDLRAYLRCLADRVWVDQTEARQFGLELQEETITELLLLQMARDLTPHGLNVRMFSKREEGGRKRPDGTVAVVGNGADWEWFVELPHCMVGFRVQAKRLFGSPSKNGYYGGLKSGGTQTDDLIKAAGSDMNPVYVFYNHGFAKNSQLMKRSTKTNWFGGSAWGCSVATASFVKTLQSRTLAAAFPGMVPWHRFFALGNSAVHGCAVKRMMAGMKGAQEFKLAEERPDWVRRLLDSSVEQLPSRPETPIDQEGKDTLDEKFADESDDGASLNGLLRERGLDGFAYFDFRGS